MTNEDGNLFLNETSKGCASHPCQLNLFPNNADEVEIFQHLISSHFISKIFLEHGPSAVLVFKGPSITYITK